MLTVILLSLFVTLFIAIILFFVLHVRDTTSVPPLVTSPKRLQQMKIAYEIKMEKELEDSYTVK